MLPCPQASVKSSKKNKTKTKQNKKEIAWQGIKCLSQCDRFPFPSCVNRVKKNLQID